MELRLDLSKSLWENLGDYHERAKKLKRKIAKLDELIANPPKQAVRKDHGARTPQIFRKRKRDWYEKFRWCFTPSGLLAIGGRDAKTNEILVRNYLSEKDLYFHADVVGAPSVVLKDGQIGNDDDIFSAAALSAVYSKAWKNGLASADVFFVLPEQVSLAPPSGEYRPRGGVMVYGKRQWLKNVPLKAYIGFDDAKNRFFISFLPPEEPHVAIAPGDIPRTDAARAILRRFGKGKEFMDDLNLILPPGGVRFLD